MGTSLKASNKDFANLLKKIRAESKLSQKPFAKALGVSASAIAMYETGRGRPGVEFVEKLAQYAKLPPEHTFMLHLAGARSHGWKV
jgi:transcriptional regulator with XRE-family HTH domain